MKCEKCNENMLCVLGIEGEVKFACCVCGFEVG